MKKTYYITTPIYYQNAPPHIGHAYSTIKADVLARYQRQFGKDVFFLTGADEHGQKIQQSAEKLGLTPQELVDENNLVFQSLWELLGISYDDYIRTTEERHTSVVQEILQNLYDSGWIYKGEYSGFYCTPCETFYNQEELVEDCCPACNRAVD